MKKFEEEVKRPTATGLIPLTYRENVLKELSNVAKANYTKNAQILREHKEYIDFLESRLKECEKLRIEANNEAAMEYSRKCEVVEDRAELKRENQRLKAENIAVKTLVEDAKKKQPEIPEVPQFVANWYEENKGSLDYMIFETCRDLTDESTNEFENWFGYDENKAITTLVSMKNGYTIKEKRFYLKHKSVLIFDPDSDDSDVDELYLGAGGNFVPYQHLAKIFTQREIDSMETGSYEQIKAEEKHG